MRRGRGGRGFSSGCCQGYEVAEIAKREGLTPQRIRQIVSQARRERSEAEQAEFAAIETEGLEPLLKRAARLVVQNDPAAIRALGKLVDRLDRLVPAADARGVDERLGGHDLSEAAPFRHGRARPGHDGDGARVGGRRYFFASLKPRKPLKSPVSDERIQGNPSQLKSKIATKTEALCEKRMNPRDSKFSSIT